MLQTLALNFRHGKQMQTFRLMSPSQAKSLDNKQLKTRILYLVPQSNCPGADTLRGLNLHARCVLEARQSLVALDVEFAHFCIPHGIKTPAEVCIVGWNLDSLYHSYINPGPDLTVNDWNGGVEFHYLKQAKNLYQVAQQVISVIAGKAVVGHSIRNDLAALDVKHPEVFLRDTMQYPVFQGKGGQSATLKALAKTHLDMDIQPKGKPHSARIDAQAAMLLYKRVILADPSRMLHEEEMVHSFTNSLFELARAELQG